MQILSMPLVFPQPLPTNVEKLYGKGSYEIGNAEIRELISTSKGLLTGTQTTLGQDPAAWSALLQTLVGSPIVVKEKTLYFPIVIKIPLSVS